MPIVINTKKTKPFIFDCALVIAIKMISIECYYNPIFLLSSAKVVKKCGDAIKITGMGMWFLDWYVAKSFFIQPDPPQHITFTITCKENISAFCLPHLAQGYTTHNMSRAYCPVSVCADQEIERLCILRQALNPCIAYLFSHI